jgi:dephospho-CoA kinase
VLDADEVAHVLLAGEGGAVEAVASVFGREVLSPGGGVDRRALGRVVFTDPAARLKLEGILHPRIISILDSDIESFERRHGSGIVVVDAALMVETGTYERYHRLVVAHCPPEIQRERLMRRSEIGAEEAEARIGAQAPLAGKMKLADYLIDTEGSLERTRESTLRVAALLEEDMSALPRLARRREEKGAC